MLSTASTNEVAVAGVTSGLISLGESVTWRATHLGVRQHLTATITMYNRPQHFRDEMVKGAFKSFKHDHYFQRKGDQTEMRDVFDFEAPLGLLGHLANFLFLKRYMHKFLTIRNETIKTIAESGRYNEYIAEATHV